jgi:phage terminase small subunit
MPTKVVSAETMEVGKKGKGKHWTQAQVSARQAAAETLKREEPVKLKPPPWLSKEAKLMWDKKLKETIGVDLLDVLDEESLAIYCDTVVKYRMISGQREMTIDDHKTMQAYSRIIAQYADKLGFTPAARARLVKKRAEEKPKDPFGEDFD